MGTCIRDNVDRITCFGRLMSNRRQRLYMDRNDDEIVNIHSSLTFWSSEGINRIFCVVVCALCIFAPDLGIGVVSSCFDSGETFQITCTMEQDVIFSVFDGEAWDLVGSRNFTRSHISVPLA